METQETEGKEQATPKEVKGTDKLSIKKVHPKEKEKVIVEDAIETIEKDIEKDIEKEIEEVHEEELNPNFFDKENLRYHEVVNIKRAVNTVIDNASNRTKMIMFDILDVCDDVLDKLRKLDKRTPEFTEYAIKYDEIHKPYCEVVNDRVIYFAPDDNMSMLLEDGSPRIKSEILANNANRKEVVEELERAIRELDEEYKDVIEARSQQRKEFNKFIRSKVEDVEFPKINIAMFPEMNYKGSGDDMKVLKKSILILEQ